MASLDVLEGSRCIFDPKHIRMNFLSSTQVNGNCIEGMNDISTLIIHTSYGRDTYNTHNIDLLELRFTFACYFKLCH